jgi:hypothetical protein
MIELEQGGALDINLREDSHGKDRVVIVLQAHGCELNLAPHQARVLATELIMAVNRAEVRSNLKRNQHMVRGKDEAPQRRGPFHQSFAK